jgi:hypothetical protein
LTEQEREVRRLQVLRARLQQDWKVVEGVARRLSTAVERVRRDGPDEVTVGATALYLQNLYTAAEELLKRIASEIDGSVPRGDDWHRELLDQLKTEISDLRPAVLDPELYGALNLLRRFRHLVRHAYAAEYDWQEMQSVLTAAHALTENMPPALAQVDAWLEQTINRL